MINNYALAQQGLVHLGSHCLIGFFAQQGLVQSVPQALAFCAQHGLVQSEPQALAFCPQPGLVQSVPQVDLY